VSPRRERASALKRSACPAAAAVLAVPAPEALRRWPVGAGGREVDARPWEGTEAVRAADRDGEADESPVVGDAPGDGVVAGGGAGARGVAPGEPTARAAAAAVAGAAGAGSGTPLGAVPAAGVPGGGRGGTGTPAAGTPAAAAAAAAAGVAGAGVPPAAGTPAAVVPPASVAAASTSVAPVRELPSGVVGEGVAGTEVPVTAPPGAPGVSCTPAAGVCPGVPCTAWAGAPCTAWAGAPCTAWAGAPEPAWAGAPEAAWAASPSGAGGLDTTRVAGPAAAADAERATTGVVRGTWRTGGIGGETCCARAAAPALTRCSSSAERSGARPAHSRRRFSSRACEKNSSARSATPTSAANAAIAPTCVSELESESADGKAVMNPGSV
jgi:hypothetical protein